MTADRDVAEHVRRLLAEILDIDVPSEDLDVFDTGRLDSLGLVELIFAIEQDFVVSVPPEELEIEHFRTPRSIAAFVAGLRTGRGGVAEPSTAGP